MERNTAKQQEKKTQLQKEVYRYTPTGNLALKEEVEVKKPCLRARDEGGYSVCRYALPLPLSLSSGHRNGFAGKS